jgi:hypothetical protein
MRKAAQRTLEQRVAMLEQQVAELKVKLANGEGTKDWRRTIGMFAGDEVMKRILDEALRFREQDRERARRRYAKGRRKKE